MQKKGEKTSPENLVPICPALSRFVHQPPILQHYKSPLLCSGVTNRRGRRCKTGLVNGKPNPSRTDFDFRQKIPIKREQSELACFAEREEFIQNSKVCFVCYKTVFRA